MALQRIRGSGSGFISSGYEMPQQLGRGWISEVFCSQVSIRMAQCRTHLLQSMDPRAGPAPDRSRGGGWWDRSEEGWRGNRGVGGLDMTLEARAAWTSVPLFNPHQLTSPPPHTNTHYSTHTHTHTAICCLQRFIIPNPDRIKEASPDVMSPVRAQGRSPD